MRAKPFAILAVLLLLLGSACTGDEGSNAPPRGTIRDYLDTSTGIRWFVTRSGIEDSCYDVIAEAQTGQRTKHSGLGCNLGEPEGTLPEVAHGGFQVIDAESYNFSIGIAPKDTKIIRATFADGHVYSDSHPSPVWFIVWPSFSFEMAKIEGLDSYGGIIATRDIEQPIEPVHTLDPGTPLVSVSPREGPVGTKVTISGSGFDELSRSRVTLGDNRLGLTRDFGGCRLRGASDIQVSVDASGNLNGSFVIADKGSCGSGEEASSFLPGSYAVFVGCVECKVAEFRITA